MKSLGCSILLLSLCGNVLVYGGYSDCVAQCSMEFPSGLPTFDTGKCCDRVTNLEKKLGQDQCRGTTIKFPRSSQTSDYVRVKSPFPRTTELTLCASITFNSNGLVPGTLISYSTLTDYNAFLILNNVVAFRTTEFTIPDHFATAGTRAHFCLAIRVQDDSRTMKAYLNGERVYEQELETSGAVLPSGGYFLIGQEQDSLMGTFDRNQAYVGDIDNLRIWDSALSDEDISNLHNNCPCQSKATLVPNENNVQLYGAVTLLEYTDCLE